MAGLGALGMARVGAETDGLPRLTPIQAAVEGLTLQGLTDRCRQPALDLDTRPRLAGTSEGGRAKSQCAARGCADSEAQVFAGVEDEAYLLHAAVAAVIPE